MDSLLYLMSIKFTASGSSSTGQNSILAAIKMNKPKQDKFGKGKDAKEEKRSPSVQRSKTAAEEAIEAATPTQGVPVAELSIEEKLEADKKKHKGAIDGDNDAADTAYAQTQADTEADEKMEVKKDGDDMDFDVLLEKERRKRREVEDAVDEMKNEISWQREALAKATHSLGRVIQSSLQTAERADQITIFVVKKKTEKARAFFEAYKSLQKLVVDTPELVSISNNGPMLQIVVVGPEHIRDSMEKVKTWERRSGIDAAVFKGKSVLSQMLELPIRAAFNAMLSILKLDPKAAREGGLSTSWMDFEKKWAICHVDKQIIRGKCDVDTLTSEVHINMEAFDQAGAAKLIEEMKAFTSRDRFGSLLELTYMKIEQFNGEAYGRQARQKGGGKGKY